VKILAKNVAKSAMALQWIIIFCSAAVYSNESSFPFLNRSYSPRTSALAAATIADNNDINTIMHNPAALATLPNIQACLHYTKHLLDMNAGMISVAYPMGRYGAAGASVIYFNYGAFDEIDQYGESSGTIFTARDMALAFSYANYLTKSFAFGLTVKSVASRIDQYNAQAYALDLGLNWKALNSTQIGFALSNLGKNYKPYDLSVTDLPTNISLGFVQSSRFPISLYFTLAYPLHQQMNSQTLFWAIGSEIRLHDSFCARLGYRAGNNKRTLYSFKENAAGLAFGFGILYENSSLDYSFSHLGQIGHVHQFGLTFHLTSGKKKAPLEKLIQSSELQFPTNIKIRLINNQMIVTWGHIAHSSYNIYVQYAGRTGWIKMNEIPLRTNQAVMKKPTLPGIYKFCVTSLSADRESKRSKSVIVRVE
jgi:hypothetical protein